MKAVVGVVLLASSTAHAEWNYRTGHETDCQEVVVGRCGAFGAGWRPPMLRLELGPLAHHTSIDPMVGTEEDGTPSGRILDGGDLSGRGFGGRIIMGYRGYYGAMDIGVMHVGRGPAVHPIEEGAARGSEPHGSSSGWIVAMRSGLGKEFRLGRLMLGGELGVGLGIVSLGALEQPHVHDARLLLDARVHAGVWLTRHVSVSTFASTSLVRGDERTFGVSLGLALFPWDGLD